MLKAIKCLAASLLVAPAGAQDNVIPNAWNSLETFPIEDTRLKPVFDASYSTSIGRVTPDTIATGINKAKTAIDDQAATISKAATETIATSINKAKTSLDEPATIINKGTTAIDAASPNLFDKPGKMPKFCCEAMTAPCLACEQGVSVREFCAIPKNKRYCQGHRDKSGKGRGKGKAGGKNTPAAGTGTKCISDEDCLQLAGAHQCPLFCVEGQCAAWQEDYPPVLHLRSGIPVKTGTFVLREDPELEEVFKSNKTSWLPQEMLEGRFLERVEGSNELLEVKYPKGFFEMAAKELESAPGDVAASEPTRDIADFELFDSAGPSIAVPGVNPGRVSDDDGPRIAAPGVNPGTVSWGARRGNQDFGRRLTAIQDEAPDRWHSGVMNTQFPWRMTGRLSMGCTAALIGNRVLVTAAHCVWDKNTGSWDDFPTFAAGQDGTDQPFGTARVSRMTMPSCYQTCNTNNECRGCDWAVLVLRNSDRLNVGYFGFSTNKNGRLNLAGYPQSKNREQWYDHCPLFSDEGKWVKHRCDTEPGNSGSGIYTIRNGNRYIVSIHGGGYTDLWNRGADIAGRTSSAGRVYDRMLSEKRIYG